MVVDEDSTKVLIVDDEKDICEVFKEHLEIRGFNVVGVAHNGKEGAEKYFEKRPDVVLLDIMMPEYDGLYALEKIKMDNQNSKVIVITADFSPATKKRLREVNADSVLYKPVKIDHVITAIRQLTDNTSYGSSTPHIANLIDN